MGWRVRERLGAGGWGEVYRAVSPEGEDVAVKVLSGLGTKEKSSFEQQVRLLLRLRHPSLAAVQGYLLKSEPVFGEDRGPCYWMDYVEGAEILEAARSAEVVEIWRWFREALAVLKHVHSQGIRHGDLSPKNLLIDRQGKLRVLDFSVLPDDPAAAETATFPYMAPERIDGRLLPASDLFSLGTVFYEALAGVHPRGSCASLQAMIRLRPKPLLEAAAGLQGFALAARVIDRMTASDLSERLSDAGKILEILEQGEWKETEAGDADFYPLRMLGAEGHFAAAQEAFTGLAERSVVLAVHGPAGVGKTRFAREMAFEAAMKGAALRDFPDLHELPPEELKRVFESLRSLPARGAAAVVTWNDDRLTPETARFFDNLVASGLVREFRLGKLCEEDVLSLLRGALGAEDARAACGPVFARTDGNPARVVETMNRLKAAGKIARGRLKPGWKEWIAEYDPPKELLKARLGDLSSEALAAGALGVAEELRKEARAPEALAVIDFALGIVADSADASRLLRLKTNLLSDLGRLEDALSVCDLWFSLKADDEPAALKEVKYWLVTGLNLLNLGRSDDAEVRLRRCVQEAGRRPGDSELAPHALRAFSTLGLLELERGHTDAARELFEKGLERAETRGWRRAEILRNLAVVRARDGDWPAARRLLKEAGALYRAEGHAEGEFSTLLQEGNLACESGDMEAAEAAYGAAEAAAGGSDLKLALVWNNRGFLDRLRGRFAPALERLHKAHDVFRFFGNPKDLKENLRQLAVAEASVGRFEKAESILGELGEPGGEAARMVSELRRGGPEGSSEDARKKLKEIYEDLTPELQVTFVERGDWREVMQPPREGGNMKENLPGVLPALKRLNEDLLRKVDMTEVLQSLMEAAIRLARAENGFLVLKDEAAQGPLPGYRIAVARNVTQAELQTEEYAFSLSAVRHALQKGEALVTDNALEDPLFRNAKSVHIKKLKSILALPVRGADEILGVFYLDHRFQDGIFDGPVMEAMETFASVAALALQKGTMIEELKRANASLSDDVAEQSDRVQALEREVKKSRIVLKNEYSDIVGRSPRMMEVLTLVDRITDADIPVWVFGESGTGKEAIARSLHFNGGRAKKPFVTENCSALPEGLLESELFGHKKGAFTHATSDKKGILQYANGGTIFLDEIADMSLNLQAKLLRFLQEGEIRPIGSSETLRVDVRVVSASNKDLAKLVEEGKFREDLFYRLNGVTVRLPPLRERAEDLPLLAAHFLKKIAEKTKKPLCVLDPAALRLFHAYSWPGNIRELQNTLQTAVLFAEKGNVTPVSLGFKPALFASGKSPESPRPVRTEAAGLDPDLEKTLLAVRDHCYHKGHAAKALGIARRTLYARLQRFGIGTDRASLKSSIEKYFG